MENKEKQTLVIGVTSSIAIYKTLDVISKLRDYYNIHVVMSENARKMVSPVTFSTMSQNSVRYDNFSEKDWISHISLADDADIFAVIPATANVIAKIACGIGDDLLSTVAIATRARKIIAPAMNVNMWENPIVQKNLNTLISYGWEVIEPAKGVLACNYEGKGKLANVDDIIKHIKGEKPFKGKKVVITSGGTIEDIDPVRYITNRSSGTMGIRFAEASRDLGAEVILIHGSMKHPVPSGVKGIGVRSALDMLEALRETVVGADVLVMAAAVADFRVKSISDEKVKKKEGEDNFILELVKNPDILKTIKPELNKKTKVIAFALESQNLMENAEKKLKEKGAHMLVANSTKEDVSPFGGEASRVYLLHKDGSCDDFGLLSKKDSAYKVLNEVLKVLF